MKRRPRVMGDAPILAADPAEAAKSYALPCTIHLASRHASEAAHRKGANSSHPRAPATPPIADRLLLRDVTTWERRRSQDNEQIVGLG